VKRCLSREGKLNPLFLSNHRCSTMIDSVNESISYTHKQRNLIFPHVQGTASTSAANHAKWGRNYICWIMENMNGLLPQENMVQDNYRAARSQSAAPQSAARALRYISPYHSVAFVCSEYVVWKFQRMMNL